MNESLLLVGRIGKPFGVKGFCRIVRYSDNPGRFVGDIGKTFLLRDSRKNVEKRDCVLELERVTVQGDSLLLKWKGIDSPEDLRKVSGLDIFWNGPDDWSPEGEGEFRVDRLLGLAVVDIETRNRVGTVVDFYERPGQDLLVISAPSGDVFCPFVEEIVPRVDLGAGEVHVRWSVVGTSE